jgi:hypothetical protein
VSQDDDPEGIYLSLVNNEAIRLLDNVRWFEIPVAGQENALGQAVVCVYAQEEDKEEIEDAVSGSSCQVLSNEAQVRAKLVAPFQRRRNPQTGNIEFLDGEQERDPRKKEKLNISREITDPIVKQTQ